MSLSPEPPDTTTFEAAENHTDSLPDTANVLDEANNETPSTNVDLRTVPIKELLARKRRRDGLKLMPSTVKERQERKRKRLSERAGTSEAAGENSDQPEVTVGGDNNSTSADNPLNSNANQPVPPENVGDNTESGDEETEDFVAPQVTLDEDGNIIIDQASLVVSATVQTANGDCDATTVELPSSDAHVTSASFAKRDGPVKWTDGETERFYQALRSFGTDFTLMQRIFPSRSRGMLKRKFKREERENAEKIDQALGNRRDDTDRNLLTDVAETLLAPQEPSNEEPGNEDTNNEQTNDSNIRENDATDNGDAQADQVVGRASDDEIDGVDDGSPNIDFEHIGGGPEFLDGGDESDDDD